jgi:hypothetical protein
MAQRDNRRLDLHPPAAGPTGRCPVQSSTPLGPHQVNILLLLRLTHETVIRPPAIPDSRRSLGSTSELLCLLCGEQRDAAEERFDEEEPENSKSEGYAINCGGALFEGAESRPSKPRPAGSLIICFPCHGFVYRQAEGNRTPKNDSE